MKYSKEEFLKNIGASIIHERFFDSFEQTMAEYDRSGAEFLSDEFFGSVEMGYAFLEEKREFLLRELRLVRECELAARYSLLLYRMLERNYEKPIIRLSDRPMPESADMRSNFEMAAYFALLAFAPRVVKNYERRGVPKQIIKDTLFMSLCSCIGTPKTEGGRCRFNDDVSFWWNQHYTNCNIITIGVLNFEIKSRFARNVTVFKSERGEYEIFPTLSRISSCGYISGTAGHEDEELDGEVTKTDTSYTGYSIDTARARVTKKRTTLQKSEWHVALSKGDEVVSLHISRGAKITPEECKKAFLECIRIMKENFPEYNPKAFTCTSWLLDPQLSDMLPESSNIVNFGKQFLRFPVCSPGTAVFSFLFTKPFSSYAELPENTTLERRVKAHYLDGGYIYDTGGVIFDYHT